MKAGTGPRLQSSDTAPKIDTGLACLIMTARFHGVAADANQLSHEFAVAGKPFSNTEILLSAKRLGLQAKVVKVSTARLNKTPLPAVAVVRNQQGETDYFIVAKVEGDQILMQSPTVGQPTTLSIDQLKNQWDGEMILFTSRASMAGEMSKFDFTWFIPAIVKYRKLLSEVLLVSFVLQIFALITPLFFQVVMDKVLVHRGFTTLNVIAVGLAGVILFEVLLTIADFIIIKHNRNAQTMTHSHVQ
jgi:ATP-binding cassette, subfamily B, bacterial HlyB/CyaB